MALPRPLAVDKWALLPNVVVGDDEVESAEAVLSAALELVLVEAMPETWTDDDGIQTLPGGIANVVYQAAGRYWGNPSGAQYKMRGQSTESYIRQVVDVLYLTEYERSVIARCKTRPNRFGGLSSIRTTRGRFEPDGLIRIEGDSDPVPYYDTWWDRGMVGPK